MPRQPDPTDADIIACLEAQENKSLLRFITCGSVDDGKSTLIGRLLYESKMIFEDHLRRITRVVDTSGQHFRQIKAPACLTQQQRPAVELYRPQTGDRPGRIGVSSDMAGRKLGLRRGGSSV